MTHLRLEARAQIDPIYHVLFRFLIQPIIAHPRMSSDGRHMVKRARKAWKQKSAKLATKHWPTSLPKALKSQQPCTDSWSSLLDVLKHDDVSSRVMEWLSLHTEGDQGPLLAFPHSRR